VRLINLKKGDLVPRNIEKENNDLLSDIPIAKARKVFRMSRKGDEVSLLVPQFKRGLT